MRSLSMLGTAALLAALPVAVHAQTATAQEVVVKENTTVVVKEAPKPSPVTFTPYGFFLVNAFFNDSLGSRNYPFPTLCAGGAQCEGNVLFDVRQSRLGARLAFNDKAGWTGATLSALVEIDFQGGYAGAVPTTSVGFYSPVVRLRKAYADATWDLGTDSKLTLRLGQDDFIVSPLRPVSLAYVANPLFQFAGTLNGRAPMFAIYYALTPKDGLSVTAVAAALNPQDNTSCESAPSGTTNLCTVSTGAAVDLGSGNRSRVPNLEGRLGLGWRAGGKNLVNLQGWAGFQKNRFVNPSTDSNWDTNSFILGGDMTLNVSLVQVMGSIYTAQGWDMAGTLGASQGVAIATTRPDPTKACGPANLCTIVGTNSVKALGGWFQVVVGPSDLAQVYGGWGGTQSPADAYVGTQLQAASTRIQNYQWAAGLIGYAGKNWRFSAEYSRATSFFFGAATGSNTASQGQFSINSQVVF